MKCQILFSVKNKKTILNLASIQFAQRVEKANLWNMSNLSKNRPTKLL